MEIHCKVCGRPLRDPVSIARGIGPICLGVTHSGKYFRSSRRVRSETSYSVVEENYVTTNLFSFLEDRQDRVPETLRRFPPDLVDLALSAPATGSIAERVKWYSRQRQKINGMHPAKLLKQIRRMCIELHLLFWPGLSLNLEPIPCIPQGENDWKIGQNGRVISKDELVAYLTRYGIISSQSIE